MKVFIAWAIDPTADSGVINCGEFTTVEAALAAINVRGLKCAEVETEFRADAQIYSMNKGQQMAYQMTHDSGFEIRVVVEQGKPNRVQAMQNGEWAQGINRSHKTIIAKVKSILAA